ncbi:MAG: pitrilysin family protein [Nitrospirota bacterium]
MKRLIPIIVFMLALLPACATVQSSMPQPKPEAIKGPIGERFVLDNGMVLLVKENHALPMVMVNVLVKAGAVMEPPEKAGLAHLTAGLLTKGAAGMSATEISERIDFIGGSLSTGAGTDFATAGLTVLKKDVDTGFSLLSQVLMSPDFKEPEIDRLKTSIKAGIIREEEEPSAVASKAFMKMVFGDANPYGREAEGTVQSLDKITRDDVVSFHKRLYAPNNAIIAVVGDISATEAKMLVARFLAGWEKKEIPAPVIPEPPVPNGVEEKLIDRDITQADVLMGHRGVMRENPDYYTLYVMNYILGGGGFVSRILDKIRDDMGLAYSAYSYFTPDKYDGLFTVGLETKNSTTKLAIDETIKIVDKIRVEPVTDKELQDAKDYITGSFARKMDTNAKIAELLTQVEFYNLGLDYFQTYEREVLKVTKDDVLKAAQKYLHPDNMYIVVVGNLKEAGMEKQAPAMSPAAPGQ